jgi:CHAT domain-containing protein/tetratricopeptide (TPR) repeat protein
MSSLRLPIALVVLAALSSAQQAPFADDTAIDVDAPVEIELQAEDPLLSSKGRGRWFRLEPAASGPLTIDVESFDLDVFLLVRDETNTEIARDMGSGVDWNAHLVLQAEAGRTYRVGALAASDQLGTLRVSVRGGAHAVPEGRALLQARVDFNREAAARARARGDEAALGKFLLNTGNLAFNLQDLAASTPPFEELLELARRRDDAARETLALSFLGAIDVRQRRPQQALERLVPALEGARTARHGAGERFVLDNLGDALVAMNRQAEAEPLYRELLESARGAGDTASEIIALRKLGETRAHLGDHGEARTLLEQSVARAAALGDADSGAESLLHLGHHLLGRGEVLGALECYEAGLRLGPDESVAMALVGSLGNVHLSAGRYDDARSCYEQVHTWALASDDRRALALARQNLGLVSFRLGDVSGALEDLGEALSLLDPIDARDRARIHYELAICRHLRGEIEAERTELETALALAREAGLVEWQALVLARMGGRRMERADLDAARRLLDEAEQLLPPDAGQAVRGVVKTHLADIARASGQLELADRLAREAADLLLGWGETGAALEALHALAKSALERGDLATVEATILEAEPLLARPMLSGLGVDERAGMRSFSAGWAEVEPDLVALRLARAGDDQDARARILAEGFARTGRWKGRALLEGLTEHRRPTEQEQAAAVQREHEALLADRAELSRRLARSRSEQAPRPELAQLETAAAGLGARVDALSARLQELAPRESLLAAPRTIGPDEARASLLAPGRVLVEYVAGERDFYAYVLSTGSLVFVELGAREDIEAACRRHLDGMADPERLASVAQVVDSGGGLYERLLAPVLAAADDGGPSPALLIVPTGELALLPFESLVLGGEGAATFEEVEFVLDRFAVDYGPSTPVLVALADARPRRADGRVVVLGDPVYPVEAPGLGDFLARGVPRADQLMRLPATREEALAVAEVVLRASGESDVQERLQLVRDERSAAFRTPAIDLFLGLEASPERLSGDLSAFRVIHCASHGYADPQDPRRSGLVLAFGAERAGYVPLADLLDLRLDADLTVLSACQTAQGRVLRGEGVQSVARAFLHAGSRHVVASLWQVSDVETARTMQHFYEGWMADGQRLPEALRSAKLALRHGAPAGTPALRGGLLRQAPRRRSADTSGHPYYWAPFVHIGGP